MESSFHYYDSNPSENPVLQVRYIPHNLRLVTARKAKSWSQPRLAQEIGVSTIVVSRIETLHIWPNELIIDKICCALETPADILFPEELCKAFNEGLFGDRVKEFHGLELMSLTEARRANLLPAGNAEDEDIEVLTSLLLRDNLKEALKTLLPKHRVVIQLRFGMETDYEDILFLRKKYKMDMYCVDRRYDVEGYTLEQVAKIFGLTREAIRSIESKGLRLLRHPTRSTKLKEILDAEIK